MFTTRESIKEVTGVEVDQATLATAQMMIEAFIGRAELDVESSTDRNTLGRAVTFQAIYINGQSLDMLEQVALKASTIGATTTTFNTDMLAPLMSPWAVLTCKNLSWRGTRTVKTGRIFGKSSTSFTEWWLTN